MCHIHEGQAAALKMRKRLPRVQLEKHGLESLSTAMH